MKKKIIIEEWEFEEIKEIIESILGYVGFWNNDDIISVKRKTGHEVSMRVDIFLEQLRHSFSLPIKKTKPNKLKIKKDGSFLLGG